MRNWIILGLFLFFCAGCEDLSFAEPNCTVEDKKTFDDLEAAVVYLKNVDLPNVNYFWIYSAPLIELTKSVHLDIERKCEEPRSSF